MRKGTVAVVWTARPMVYVLLLLCGGAVAMLPVSASAASATGGVVTNYDENGTNFTAHSFSTVGATSLVVTSGGSFDILVVGGGGGGSKGWSGLTYGGGGGGGGWQYFTSQSLTAGVYSIAVGAGGVGNAGGAGTHLNGGDGEASQFWTLTAAGGGLGGRTNGYGGASGSPQSYAGGYHGGGAPFSYAGGGGGGAGGAAATAVDLATLAGGIGISNSISGVGTGYGGGGGGATDNNQGAGRYGGGMGGKNGVAPTNGTPNTGGGGGGWREDDAGSAGSGGSGIVIVRYVTPSDYEGAYGGYTKTNYTEGGTNFVAYVFTNSGSLTLGSDKKADILVVGGGGGGGQRVGGGGGAGGVVYATNYTIARGTKTVVVGAGGAGATVNGAVGTSGQNSVFDSAAGAGVKITAYGGGGGSSYNRTANPAGASGGSGGGGNYSSSGSRLGGSATQDNSGVAGAVGYGNNGGAGASAAQYGGGGGGGAGSVGTNATGTVAGHGGIGVYFAEFTNLVPSTTGTVHDGWFGGGGGGSATAGTHGDGGRGGGGRGAPVRSSGDPAPWYDGTNGLANTGGGGGGASDNNNSTTNFGGRGGSGVVIVRFVMISPDLPVIANVAATGITATAAWVNGSLTSTGTSETTVWVFWGTTDGTTNAGSWASSNNLGTVTVVPTSYTYQVTSLTKGSTNYFNYYAVNASGVVWAASTGRSYVTLGAPAVNNGAQGATNIGVGTATLNGTLVTNGGAAATMYIVWGTNDFGASTGAWPNVVNFGVKASGQTVSTNLTGLFYGLRYWYRTYATNTYGEAIAAATNFLTSQPTTGAGLPPTVGSPFSFWLDASTLTGADDSVVTTWNWMNGAGTTSAMTLVNSPRLRTGANGMGSGQLPIVRFNGANYAYTTVFTQSGNRATAFVVVREASVNSAHKGIVIASKTGVNDYQFPGGYVLDHDDAGGEVHMEHNNNNPAGSYLPVANRPFIESGVINMSSVSVPSGPAAGRDYWHVRDGTDATGASRVTQTYNHGLTSSYLDSHILGVGMRYTGSFNASYGLSGDIGEVIVYTNALNDADRVTIENYLYDKWVNGVVPQGLAMSITNVAATEVQSTAAKLNATLSGSNSYFQVWAYWGTVDGTNNADGLWANTNYVGAYTLTGAVTQTNINWTIGGLGISAQYYYTFLAANAATNLWASPSTNFTTAGPAPIVTNAPYGATNVTGASVWLNGYLANTGTTPTTVSVYWGPTDGGDPTSGLWQATNTFAAGQWAGLSYPTTNVNPASLFPGSTEFFYRYYATNSAGHDWSASSVWFMTTGLTVTATGASEWGANGLFTISRPAAATSRAVTVTFALGGSATYGTDYTLSTTGSVTLLAGVTGTNITLIPVFDYLPAEGTEYVNLMLTWNTNSSYALEGSATNVQAAIQDAVIKVAATNSLLDPASFTQLGMLNPSSSVIFNTANLTVTVDGSVVGTGTNGYSQSGNVRMAVFAFNSVNLGGGVAVTVTGNQGMTLLSRGDITIGTTLSVAGTNAAGATGGLGGSGAEGGARTVSFSSSPPGSTRGKGGNSKANPGIGYGGGAGGSSGAGGGYGGTGGNGSGSPGGVSYGDVAMTNLFGGSGGGAGSNLGTDGENGGGGGGGGALELVAKGQITIGGSLLATGGIGGTGVADRGGGGGSGGGILLAAPQINVSGTISVAGGAGGQGTRAGGGGGAGGRIAFYTSSSAFTNSPPNYTNVPAAYVSNMLIGGGAGAPGGGGEPAGANGGSGTFYKGDLPDFLLTGGTLFMFR